MPVRDPNNIHEYAPGVPGSRISDWGGLDREANRTKLQPNYFRVATNVRLENGEISSRAGLSKKNSSDAGSGICSTGIDEIPDDDYQPTILGIGGTTSDFTQNFTYSKSLGVKENILAPAVDTDPWQANVIEDVDGTLYAITNASGRSAVGTYKISLKPEDENVVGALSAEVFSIPDGAEIVDMQSYESREERRAGQKDLWLVVHGSSGAAVDVYRWNGTQLSVETDSAFPVIDDEHWATIFSYQDEIYVNMVGNSGGTPTTYSNIMRWDGTATWTAIDVSVGLAALATDLGAGGAWKEPYDMVYAEYKGKVYFGGAAATETIFSVLGEFDGTNLTWRALNNTTGPPPDAGTPVSSLLVHDDGNLYYCYNDDTSPFIGKFTGSVYTDKFVDMGAKVTVAAGICFLFYAGRDVYFLGNGSLHVADDPNALDGTWTTIDASITSPSEGFDRVYTLNPRQPKLDTVKPGQPIIWSPPQTTN